MKRIRYDAEEFAQNRGRSQINLVDRIVDDLDKIPMVLVYRFEAVPFYEASRAVLLMRDKIAFPLRVSRAKFLQTVRAIATSGHFDNSHLSYCAVETLRLLRSKNTGFVITRRSQVYSFPQYPVTGLRP
jgi:hypothetical protein